MVTLYKKKIIVPEIKRNRTAFDKKMLSIIDNGRKKLCKPILMPMEEETLEWVEYNRSKLNSCNFLIPPQNAFLTALDKYKTIEFAKMMDIDVLQTLEFPTSEKLLNYLCTHKGKYVVKPKRGKGSLGIIYIKNNIPVKRIKDAWLTYGELILQDMLPPEGESICVSMIYSNHSELSVHFMHRRIYSYPITGGPSTYRISVKSTELLEKSRLLLEKLNWVGVAMVEWKRDIRDNRYKLMEINPRFWGGLELAIKCGVNFPKVYADLASGKEVSSESFQYKENVIARWLLPGDILRFIGMKKNKQTVREFFSHIIRDSDEWDRTDLSGSIASVLCQGLQIVNPVNWKYLMR